MSLQNWHRFLPRYAMETQRLVRKASAVWFGKTLFPDYIEPEPQRNPCLAFLELETRPGGHLHWGSMQTGDWYLPDGLARLVQDAREPGGYRLHHTISTIYTCEAIIRLAERTLLQPFATAATSASAVGMPGFRLYK